MHGLIWIFKGQVSGTWLICHSRRSALSVLPLRSWAVLLLTVVTATQIGCSRADSQQAASPLELRSSSFAGDAIPNLYSSCKGQGDISPELSWNAPPDHTQSFALIVIDKDSPFGFKFTHWALYDMPSDKRELPQNTPKQEQLPDGSRQGHNDYDGIGYVGPCPPGHSAHHYVFDLYALDTKVNLPPGASKKQVLKAMKEHVLASGELVGRYQH
jgi:Raf kinase inhibitor-like YbhB/YbcL family protein